MMINPISGDEVPDGCKKLEFRACAPLGEHWGFSIEGVCDRYCHGCETYVPVDPDAEDPSFHYNDQGGGHTMRPAPCYVAEPACEHCGVVGYGHTQDCIAGPRG